MPNGFGSILLDRGLRRAIVRPKRYTVDQELLLLSLRVCNFPSMQSISLGVVGSILYYIAWLDRTGNVVYNDESTQNHHFPFFLSP
jgi:hypothetical protein